MSNVQVTPPKNNLKKNLGQKTLPVLSLTERLSQDSIFFDIIIVINLISQPQVISMKLNII